ncbi:PEGA domain-containing protein [Archangium violaceum]|uniref:PEGA domain-containing protein n=1 Tax=Archangium violaceum TaxID=83451 RepID=UPI00194FE1A5|nr:PEGA domain-containing protein [Archangium violaceum]QRN99759.1 PEGA domain-containing protein [Archangium violaceum]
MVLRRAFLIALVLSFAAPPAFAQDLSDDLAPLAPLQPSKGKGKAKKTRPPKATKAPKKGAKSQPVAEPAPAPVQDSEILAPLIRKTELAVKMTGVVRGARLFIDDKEIGSIPKGPIEVTPGEHTVAVRRGGYRDFSRRVTAKEGELTEVSVMLEAVTGFVSVKADVEGARVLIDGEDKGAAPLEGVMLSAGSHEIVVQRDGYRPETQRIAVRAGKEYNVDVNLRPLVAADEPRNPVLTPGPTETSPLTQEVPEVSTDTPLTKRWYFWAGVGAVVIGATVGTLVATQPKPLDPNTVCLPAASCDAVINGPSGASAGGGLVRF